jgi:hypothetical protein
MFGSSYTSDDVLKPCETKLHISFEHGGPHFTGWYRLDGVKWVRVSVPKGRKTLKPKLFHRIMKDMHLSKEDFKRFLDCPLKEDEYIEIQRRIREQSRSSIENLG